MNMHFLLISLAYMLEGKLYNFTLLMDFFVAKCIFRLLYLISLTFIKLFALVNSIHSHFTKCVYASGMTRTNRGW